MKPGVPVAVAPNFHLPGEVAERLLVAGPGGWIPPSADQCSGRGTQAAPPAGMDGLVLLFALPAHLRTAFWAMLEQAEAGGNFEALAAAVGRFLTFKQLPPPRHAVLELVLLGAAGTIAPEGLWALVNMGDEAVVGFPGLRLLLGPGEGCRLPPGAVAEVLPPRDQSPRMLLLVRRPAQGSEA